MNQSHYPSLELCKKLTEIGFPEGTSCHFRKNNSDTYEHTFGPWDDESYVCPSVMEMLDVMPKVIEKDGHKYWLTIVLDFTIVYTALKEGIPNLHCHIEDTWLPNALAEMILWLHENNYISFSE